MTELQNKTPANIVAYACAICWQIQVWKIYVSSWNQVALREIWELTFGFVTDHTESHFISLYYENIVIHLWLCSKDNHLARALVVMRLFSCGSILTFRPSVDRFKWTTGQCRVLVRRRVVSYSEWCINQCGRLVKYIAGQSGVYNSCRKCSQVCRFQQE